MKATLVLHVFAQLVLIPRNQLVEESRGHGLLKKIFDFLIRTTTFQAGIPRPESTHIRGTLQEERVIVEPIEASFLDTAWTSMAWTPLSLGHNGLYIAWATLAWTQLIYLWLGHRLGTWLGWLLLGIACLGAGWFLASFPVCCFVVPRRAARARP